MEDLDINQQRLRESLAEQLQKLFTQAWEQELQAGSLYLVGTPIGNLADLSPRVLAILARVDAVACEDSRRTGQLLYNMGLTQQLIPYHEHNEQVCSEKILRLLSEGKKIALVSDAGLPGISDPGRVLCAKCHEVGYPVYGIPGPSAMALAAATSGMVKQQFLFVGFLPRKPQERKAWIQRLTHEDHVFVLYEAPHRLCKTLDELCMAGLGEASLVLCRELTKKYEEVFWTTVQEARNSFSAEEQKPRGEFVLVLDATQIFKKDEQACKEDREAELLKKIYSGIQAGLSRKEAVRQVARQEGLSVRALYQLTLHSPSEQKDD